MHGVQNEPFLAEEQAAMSSDMTSLRGYPGILRPLRCDSSSRSPDAPGGNSDDTGNVSKDPVLFTTLPYENQPQSVELNAFKRHKRHESNVLHEKWRHADWLRYTVNQMLAY